MLKQIVQEGEYNNLCRKSPLFYAVRNLFNNLLNNIKKSKTMREWFLSLTLLLCLRMCESQTRNALDYVWYNYEKQVEIEDYSSIFSAATLPCETRILYCKIVYEMIPPNWSSSGNQILIPKSDLNSMQSFFVSLQGSDFTGEIAEFNVLLEIKNGSIVSTKTERPKKMMSINDFISRTTQTSQPRINGLPSSKQAEIIFGNGQVSQISKFIYDIVTSDQQCTAHQRYLQEILQIIQERIYINEVIMRPIQKELDDLQNQKSSLLNQKNTLTNNAITTKESREQKALLNRKIIEREEAEKAQKRQKIISDVFLEAIGDIQSRIVNQSFYMEEDGESLETLQMQLLAINQDLEYYEMVKQNKLSQISESKLPSWNSGEKKIKLIQSLLIGYQEYSQKANEAKEEMEEIDADIHYLQKRLKELNEGRSEVDFEINDLAGILEQLQQELRKKDEVLISKAQFRNIFSSNILSMESRLDLLLLTCQI